jgi:hypothetical protein
VLLRSENSETEQCSKLASRVRTAVTAHTEQSPIGQLLGENSNAEQCHEIRRKLVWKGLVEPMLAPFHSPSLPHGALPHRFRIWERLVIEGGQGPY